MKSKLSQVAALFLCLFYVKSAFAKAVRFDVRDAIQRDSVQFVSETALEKVIGLSTSVFGWLELDPEKVNDGVKGEFDVDVRTFDTGNPLRNDHLREKFLGVAEFPVATYTITKLTNSSKAVLADQQPVVIRVEGTLKIKGVSKSVPMLLRTTYFKQSDKTSQRLSGNLIRLSASFDVDLQSFGISIPDGLRFRLARFVQVSVDVVGSDGKTPALVPITDADKNK